MEIPGGIFPKLVEDMIYEYYWRIIYKKEVVLEIVKPENRRMTTLHAFIDCPWSHNKAYGYTWKLLNHHLHNLFVEFGTWTKYQPTLNKRAERVINITEEGETQFPIDPRTDLNNRGILLEYYKY